MLTNGPGPVKDLLSHYRLACCGLKAAEHVLAVNGLPPPVVSQIRADGPIGRCCGELTITPKPPNIITEDPDSFGNCVSTCEWIFEVCMTRCVSDWFGNESKCDVAAGACDTILTCPPDDPWVPPEKCGKRGRTQADEQALVLADRAALMTSLAEAWACCMSDPNESGCGDCADPLVLGCREVMITNSAEVCDAGCVGTIFEVTIR